MKQSWYTGVPGILPPEWLEILEKDCPGQYVAEEKKDGFWCAAVFGEAGRLDSVWSRNGRLITGSNSGELAGLEINLGEMVLIGELESGTERATKAYQQVGHKRIWLFDIAEISGSEKVAELTWVERRGILEGIKSEMPEHLKKYFPLVPYCKQNFYEFYTSILAAGGEGVVIKHKQGKLLNRHFPNIDFWKKVKPWIERDFILVGFDKTESGNVTGCWGLYVDGELKKIMTRRFPYTEGKDLPELGGVAEFRAFEQFERTGALRSAQFIRWRKDKPAYECVFPQKGSEKGSKEGL